MKKRFRSKIVLTLIAAVLFAGAITVPLASSLGHSYAAGISPSLGTAGNFGVLGATTVTNTGLTTVLGDLGVSPGTAVTGFPPGTVSGTIHAGDAVAAQAQNDAAVAYSNAAGQACNVNLTGQNLGGKTLTPGVYCFSSSAFLTGQLTLDFQGNPNNVFIFQIGSTLITSSSASVSLINNAKACNLFWQVGSSATLGTNTIFNGNILAMTSITATTDAASNGSLYALNGAVTLDTNKVKGCSGTYIKHQVGTTTHFEPAQLSCVRPIRQPCSIFIQNRTTVSQTVLLINSTVTYTLAPDQTQTISYRTAGTLFYTLSSNPSARLKVVVS